MRRPQNLKKSPTFFGIYLVTSKKVGDFFKFSYRTLKYRSFVDFYFFLTIFWGGLFGLSRQFPIGIFNFCSLCCICCCSWNLHRFFFLRISLEFSFLLYLMKVKKAAPSAACNDVEMYCEACMKKIWLGSSLGSFDVYLYQLSTKGLGPRYKEIRICGLRC